jgi:hypothetical protein
MPRPDFGPEMASSQIGTRCSNLALRTSLRDAEVIVVIQSGLQMPLIESK